MQTLLNEKQAAEKLGMTHWTLRRYRVYGGGPNYVKLGSLVKYLEADLEEFVMSNRRETTFEVAD